MSPTFCKDMKLLRKFPHRLGPASYPSCCVSASTNYTKYTFILFHHHQCSAPRAGPSLQTQAPTLQFCPKARLPLQTQEPRLQFY